MSTFKSYWYKITGAGELDVAVMAWRGPISTPVIVMVLLAGVGIPIEFVFGYCVPGVALGLLAGSLWLVWIAHKFAKKTGKMDVTTNPYGLNLPQVFAYIYGIIYPTWFATHDMYTAWAMGAAAVIWTGIFKIILAFFAPVIQKNIPRPAMLTVLATAMFAFLGMTMFHRLYDNVYVAFLALAIVFIGSFAFIKFPFKIPVMILAWIAPAILGIAIGYIQPTAVGIGVTMPFAPSFLHLSKLMDCIPYFSIIVPIVVYQFIQDLSAQQACAVTGDVFDVREMVLADGVGTLVCGLCGSVISPILYAMQPAYKRLGARISYLLYGSVLFLPVVLFGFMRPLSVLMPFPITAAQIAYASIMVGVPAVKHIPEKYRMPLLLCLIFPIGALLSSTVNSVMHGFNINLFDPAVLATLDRLIFWRSIQGLSNGYLVQALIFGVLLIHLIDRDFVKSALWAVFGAVFSWFGLMHVPRFGWAMAPDYAVGWLILAAMLFLAKFYAKPPPPRPAGPPGAPKKEH